MKVIAYSLWGTNPKYTIGAVHNADMSLMIFPGWTCRFYVGKSVPLDIIGQLIQRPNTEVFVMQEEGDWNAMFWRFLAADDPNVEVMLSRDTDCRPSIREKLAVESWLAGDKDFHIMRDHPYHQTPILGGMWGARNAVLKGLGDKIRAYEKGNFWQVDQNFLASEVYPFIQGKICVHDDFKFYPDATPFPCLRDSHDMFVGQAFNEHDQPCNPEHITVLKRAL